MILGCPEDDGQATSTGGSTQTGGVDPAECDQFTDAASCVAPCSWRSFPTYADATLSCEPGDSVSVCVYESADAAAGCAIVDGCEDAVGYIELPDGTRGMADYCGGTAPEQWTQCGPDDVAGDIPECACACPGFGESTGAASTSSGG